ncbi:hypothetical protein BJ944DRAFT_252056 [Cunninghamella echinulata]|nr:hypothetical protein BJ944DRAFT_252056 [Cunninghamella echinulata]
MIQTTLFNYFSCNSSSIKRTTNKIKQLKQTIINDYFAIKPKEKTIFEYFKQKEYKVKKEKSFDLVLVDIKKTATAYHFRNDISPSCIKKNMYDKGLKYIAISYHWGELDEQLVTTPDYTAHITSFDLEDLKQLCEYIMKEVDLKEIQYLWIDAISVDQHNFEKKKETILKMPEIYKRSAYILAVPDLHFGSLMKHTAINSTLEYREAILEDILRDINQPNTNKNEIIVEENKYLKNDNHQQLINDKAIQTENEDVKKAYQYLAYLVHIWSNRTWVISEYYIAKEKQEKYGTPLKYIFIALLHPRIYSFFSYPFDHHLSSKTITLNYWQVNNSNQFFNFLKARFVQRPYLNMLIDSNTTVNEDRFYAILPLWNKYSHWVQNKNTISNWNITDMTSVRIKLYEIMDDLWDKARLLYACSWFTKSPIIPSFASQLDNNYLNIIEKDNKDYAYEIYSYDLLDTLGHDNYMLFLSENSVMENESIYTENIIAIQLNSHLHCLSIKATIYFTFGILENEFSQEYLSTYSLKDDECLECVCIPFFTFAVYDFTDDLPQNGSTIFLLGNFGQNRWILLPRQSIKRYPDEFISCYDDYSFNIY